MATKYNWSAVADGSVPEILRLAEARLSDQLTVSLATDQRATTLAGVYGALSAGLFAADATLVTVHPFDTAAAWCIAAAALGSLIACLICVTASRPTDFFLGGYEPESLMPSATINKVVMLCFVCEDIERRIGLNNIAQQTKAKLAALASFTAAAFLVAGLAAFAIAHVCASRSF